MDLVTSYTLCLILILSFHSKVINGESSVFFIDSPSKSFLRSSAQPDTMSASEVGAAVSVLLGVAPSPSLTASSSSKLNEVLAPNPFDRPQAVLMLEVTGAEGSQLNEELVKSAFSTAISAKVVSDEPKVGIQLSDEDDVSVVSLDEVSSDIECSEKELSDFASWLGGSYVEDGSGPSRGELVLPAAKGAFLRLHMLERADLKFTKSLLLLVNNIRRTMELHGVLAKSEHSPAEIITGRFDGIKALQDHYGTEGVAQNGFEVFVTSISKIFESLQTSYEGSIVGILVHDGRHASDSESYRMVHVTTTSRSSARSLEETEASVDPRIYEVLFVRTILAWITGIILLIATILGIHFLVNMPITKDTLLYSNVKLD